MAEDPTLTAAELRKRAAVLRHEGQALLDEAERWERAADLIDGLTSSRQSTNSLQVSSPQVISAKLSRGMGRSRVKRHPFIKALYEPPEGSKRKPMTAKAWALAHDVPVASVTSWVARRDSAAARKIPMHWAKLIEKELGVPATLDVWRNGILSE
jgi:hypothetical protein